MQMLVASGDCKLATASLHCRVHSMNRQWRFPLPRNQTNNERMQKCIKAGEEYVKKQ